MPKSRKSKKRKTDPEVYVVELITKARVVIPDTDDEEDMSPKNIKLSSKGKEKQKPKAKWEYFVKWAGYGSDADSWEPEENVSSCTRLLQSFWDHVGTDNDDYAPGYEVQAKESWIKKEKAFFIKEFKSEVTHTNKGSEKSKPKTKRQKASTSEGSKQTSKALIKEESSEDDRPLALSLPARPGFVTGGKRKRKVISSEDEESDNVDRTKKSERDPKPGPLPAPTPETRPDLVPGTVETATADLSPLFSASSLSPAPPPLVETKSLPPKLPMPKPTTQKAPPAPLPSRMSQAKPLPSRTNTSDAILTSKHAHNFTRTSTTAVHNVPSSSTGISTKQRVGLGATQAVQPKEAFSRPAQLPTRSASDTLQSLSFKKFPTQSVSNQAPHPITIPADNRIFERPANSPVVRSADRTPIASPVVNAPPAATGSSFSITPAHPYKDSSMREAEAFLQSIMDPQMAAPLAPQPETQTEPVLRPLHKTVAATERATPRYKWEGNLAFNSPDNVVCRVKLAETIAANGLNFKIAMADVQTIVVSDMYDIMDICSMTPIFRPYTHVGAFLPQDTADSNSFRVLHRYFRKNFKAFFLPITMDGATVGQILFCPWDLLAAIIELPQANLQAEIFGALVLPYVLGPKQKQLSMFLPKSLDAPPYPPFDPEKFPRWNSTLKRAPLFHLGMRVLRFPHELFKWFLATKDRSCAVFPAVPSSPEQELQTRLLISVVHQTPTPVLDIRAEARLIFIHNSALHILHTLPHLVERKLKLHPWPVHFYTYGSGASPNTFPPIEEIYPCGGVITFSALAIYRNPLEVCHRIEQISKHPLWTCYLAPEVLGVLAKLLFGKADPIAELKKPHFPLDPILRRIEDGEIAYVNAPPDDQSQNGEWLTKFLSAESPSKDKALQLAVQDYLKLYRGVLTHLDMLKKLEHRMAADMLRMQRQRALMANYRRFVVLTADDEFNGSRNGTEWIHVRRFDFKDMFFSQQEVGR